MHEHVSQQENVENSLQDGPHWHFVLRLIFRLTLVYEVFYSFPFPFNLFPWSDHWLGWYERLMNSLTIWTGAHLLHLNKPLVYWLYNGGDSMFTWTRNLVYLLIAVITGTLWTIFDRKRPNYRLLQEWLWLYVRLVLGATMITYGAAKVIKIQFPDLFLWRLLSTYGDSTPTGLLWTFMGYSKTYNLFTGSIEVMAGMLLFVPRLATLGALVSVAAMANVFMLNISYDVPVKLYSFNLLLMGLYLLAPEGRRLINVFILDQAAQPRTHLPLFRKRWLNTGMLALQLLLLIYWCSSEFYQSEKRYKEAGDGAPPPPLYGIYKVEEFKVDAKEVPALFTGPRWQRVTFERFNLIGIITPAGPVQRYKIKLDQARQSLEFDSIDDLSKKGQFNFEQHSPSAISLRGELDGKQIEADLQKVELKSFPLYENGFHWIQ